jgi:hypothetical protein
MSDMIVQKRYLLGALEMEKPQRVCISCPLGFPIGPATAPRNSNFRKMETDWEDEICKDIHNLRWFVQSWRSRTTFEECNSGTCWGTESSNASWCLLIKTSWIISTHLTFTVSQTFSSRVRLAYESLNVKIFGIVKVNSSLKLLSVTIGEMFI